MPTFLCKKCGAANAVPPDLMEFTCTTCGTLQDTPALFERVEDNSLENIVLHSEEESKPDPESLFTRFASYEDDDSDSLPEDEGEADRATQFNSIYFSALSKMGGEDPRLYYEAIEQFQAISGWKDSDILIGECRRAIARLEKEEAGAQEFTRKRKKRNKLIFGISIPALMLIIGFIALSVFVLVPKNRYNKALAAEQGGDVVFAFETFMDLGNYRDSNMRAEALFEDYKPAKLKVANVGDIVYFGDYEQDNVITNGEEDISWIVTEKSDNKLLLLSRYALDCKPYNSKAEATSWENCALREWLNTDFFSQAFSEQQQQQLVLADIPAYKNPDYETDPGNNTQDKVFLLSIPEAEEKLNKQQLLCFPTAFAHAQGATFGVNMHDGRYAVTWFLRTPGYDQAMAAYVSSDGLVRRVGYSVDSTIVGIRPAVWVDTQTEN